MNFKPLQDYMNQLLEKGVPGLELAVCRDHEILFHECAGYSDEAKKVPASAKDRYWMYSCTKPVTAASSMKALEQGLFQLNDPVGKYLPAYSDVYLLKDGKRVKPQHTMTIRHLLTMTGGLDYNLNRDSVRRVQQENAGRATTVQIAEALAEDPLSFDPGERFQYSLCHDVMGAVIEQASGMTLRDYMKENIFLPLGMKNTDFETGAGKPSELAAQYRYDGEAKQVRLHGWENGYVLSPNYYSGGAGLVSCVEDYLLFADALACGGTNAEGVCILRPETIDLMRSEQMKAFHADESFSCTCGSDYGYGLGVRTRISFEEGAASALGEFGWDGAAGADVLIDPEHHLSMFYAQHVMNWPSLLGAVHLQIRDILYPLLGL